MTGAQIIVLATPVFLALIGIELAIGRARGRAGYRLNDALTLRAGTAFDKSPVSDDYRTARVPDENRVWLAIGASYQVLPGVTVDAGYAHLFVKDSSIRETSPTGDVLTGRFRNRVDIISLGTRTVF